MAKRSISFKSIRQNIPLHREMLGVGTFRREIAEKSNALKRSLAKKRDELKRDGAGGTRSPASAKTRRAAVAGVATLGAAAVAVSLAPNGSGPDDAKPASYAVAGKQNKDAHASVTSRGAADDQQAKHAAAHHKAAKGTSQKKTSAAEGKAEHAGAHRSGKASRPVYADNLDGWIRHSLHIMKKHDIPGSYDGLHRNIIRESSGDPKAVNLWDINAQNGIPSKGLLQVIPPTFKAYHVAGTSWDIYNPVANITAAANYAADRYGSMDNVNSAY